jgi:FG-GAP-like repeat
MNIAKRLSRPSTIAVAAALLAVAAPASAGDGSFAGGRDFPVALPKDLAVGDFNNDRRSDLAVASDVNDRVELLLQTDDGLVPAAPVPVGRAPNLLAVADFNADGNDDLAVANFLDRDVSVRLGTGSGAFRATTDIQLGATPSALAVGDFNNDTRDDLATAVEDLLSPSRQQILVSLGSGDGGFPAAKTLYRDAEALVVGDFNSDAIEDLAYGGFLNAKSGQVSLGTGNGEVGEPLELGLPEPATDANGWAAGDFNADGNVDVVASHDMNAVSVRLGGGNGTFPTGTKVPVEGNPRAVAVGDFNSDGNEDFVVTDAAKSGPGAAHIRLGDGAGRFRPGADLTVGFGPRDVAVADFNSDGNDDLAIANTNGHGVSVRMGGGPAPLAGNLLANGDFEGRLPGKSNPLTGWELSGRMFHLRYGAASHAFTPSWLAAPRYGTGGGFMLWGGDSTATNGITTAAQTVDVSASAEAIDAGRATGNLSAYLGGARAYGDRMAARAEFRGGAGEALGSLELGPVTAEDRRNVSTLLRRADSAVVPASTRTIRVTLTSIDDDKAFSSAIADNVKLTLTTAPAPGPADSPTPESGEAPPPTARFGPDTLVTLAPVRTRIGARQPLTVRVRNRNAFTVTGRLRGAATVRAARLALPRRSLELPQAASRTVRVPLPARARRQLARTQALRISLTAVVIDPAGDMRRVVKRIRLRLKSDR